MRSALRYRYSRWDGTQVPSLTADDVLDLMADDLLDSGDLRRALERLLAGGGLARSSGGRLEGLRGLLERLRAMRDQQFQEHDLRSLVNDLRDRLNDIVQQERSGLQGRQEQSATAPEGAREALEQVLARKQAYLDALPPDPGGMLTALNDYEFMDDGAREAFQELLRELQQQFLGNLFQGLQEGMQRLTPEDLSRLREMTQALNRLLEQRLRGEEGDFADFMARFGDLFPGVESLDDLMSQMQRQTAAMDSLLQSLGPTQRRALQEMLDALLQDDRLRADLARLGALLQRLNPDGPRGQGFLFSGDEPLALGEALRLMGHLGDMERLDRQLSQAMRELDPSVVDRRLMEELLGREAMEMLEELQRITQVMEEAGFIRDTGRDIELTPKAIRALGNKALRDIFAEIHKSRFANHDAKNAGLGLEREEDTKLYEFGDPFHVDIQATLRNALLRNGTGTPVVLSPADLEVYRTRFLTQAATVILLDMSYSMVGTGAFREGKKVAFALNSLIKAQFPKDALFLVVFSYYARELDPLRLLQSDWVEYGGGTNIQEGLQTARKILRGNRADTKQIILITDGYPTTFTEERREGWSGSFRSPGRRTGQAVEETLKEVKRCTQDDITINTFMMARDSVLVDFVHEMMRMNRGRAFFARPGQLGSYLLVDYLRNKRKVI
ncbi:MAG TPA: VWA domain-containing protein [Dehalococcoidia bacterium]|nr:VWA domain-containing protein [Dehalococcoidia bacterium]